MTVTVEARNLDVSRLRLVTVTDVEPYIEGSLRLVGRRETLDG